MMHTMSGEQSARLYEWEIILLKLSVLLFNYFKFSTVKTIKFGIKLAVDRMSTTAVGMIVDDGRDDFV